MSYPVQWRRPRLVDRRRGRAPGVSGDLLPPRAGRQGTRALPRGRLRHLHRSRTTGCVAHREGLRGRQARREKSPEQLRRRRAGRATHWSHRPVPERPSGRRRTGAGGPDRGQADSIMRMLRSTTTAVHLVTLLEDMPVTETEEAVAALRPTGISVETVIANKVIPTPLDEDQLQRAAMGTTLLRVRALNDQQNRLLTAEFADEPARTLQQRDRHRRLTSLGVPLAEIAFDAAGIDEAALFSIADQIRNQIPLEVGE